ncbi:hypothetical protein HXK74_04260 [Candidatus Gracilibacteria bacterium]|nr:hypothetical protein [Candidatus Gracilibacteria bacterium]
MKKSLKIGFLSMVLLCGVMFLSSSVFATESRRLESIKITPQDLTVSPNIEKKIKQDLDKGMKDLRNKQEAEKMKQEQQKKQKALDAQNREVGITINTECMGGVGCGLSVYDSLGIRKGRAEGERTSVMLFLQDIILGASMFIGTVAAVAFILSGVYYVFSASDASYKKKAQEGMRYAVYGLVLVTLAIVIVRITQFIARGGS